jgi:phage replication-related protein YjqB (UPF0714/DUF867 family)
MTFDKYKNFEELARNEREGVDFDIELVDRVGSCAVISIHGGNIEPGTTEIARIIAGDKYSFYSFIGKKTEKESKDLHITSSHFDEPKCLELVSKTEKVISIHGEHGKEEFIMVGGLDIEAIKKIIDSLKNAGFEVREAMENVNGNLLENICNKCLSKKGIQLEISRGLRDELIKNQLRLAEFCGIIKKIIL